MTLTISSASGVVRDLPAGEYRARVMVAYKPGRIRLGTTKGLLLAFTVGGKGPKIDHAFNHPGGDLYMLADADSDADHVELKLEKA